MAHKAAAATTGGGGGALRFEELVFRDGSRYDGHTKDGKAENVGSLWYAAGGCYEGEFHDHKPHGAGCHTFDDGSKVCGRWRAGQLHGCGVAEIKEGGKLLEMHGQWLQDAYVGATLACSLPDSRRAAEQARSAAQRAAKYKKLHLDAQ